MTDRNEAANKTGYVSSRFRALRLLPMCFAMLWAAAAIWIDGPEPGWLAAGLALALLGAFAVLLKLAWSKRWALLGAAGLFVAVLLWWLNLEPSNNRSWQRDVAQLPVAELQGSMLTIKNVRSFRYTGEQGVEEQWTTQTYNLDELVGFDIFFSYWGPTLYGHTLASWEFADGHHLVISIETRREQHEEYSALRGFFRQYELYYVVADEADAVALRTNRRGERVELYRINTPDDGDRAMLLDYVAELNALAAEPQWYNALTQNCTTTMWKHARAVGSSFPLDWRLLANGYVVELGYELGTVNNLLSLDELKRRSDITRLAQQFGSTRIDAAPFSRAIRVGLPARPGEQ